MEDELNDYNKIEQVQIEELIIKYEKLEKKMENYKIENQTLKNRLQNAESLLSLICNKLNISSTEISDLKVQNLTSSSLFNSSNYNNNNQELTWLFNTPKGYSTNDILDKLNVNKLETKIVELDTKDSCDKRNMIAKILEIVIPKNIELVNKLYEKTGTDCKNLTDILSKAFESLPKTISNIVLIIRNFPKTQSNTYSYIIDNIGTLTGILNEVWGGFCNKDRFNNLAMVIESEIPMNKLNVKFNNESMVMILDNLIK